MRICYLLHQGNMYSGGQGVYLAALSREFVQRGHQVHAVVGPPYPELDPRIVQHRLEGWSTYRLMETGTAFWRRPPAAFFKPLNLYELVTSKAGMFSVMSAFSLRAFEVVLEQHRLTPFDIVHDNQSLGYGNVLLKAAGLPLVANIHHPLSIDRRNAIAQAQGFRAKAGRALFYPFVMQHVAARAADAIVTGSEASARSVRRAFRLAEAKVHPILDGVDLATFRPGEAGRDAGRVLFVGNSDDRNKGARYLVEALAAIRERPWRLVVVDRLDARVVRARAQALGIGARVELTGRLTRDELADEYRRAEVFVSPSLYEGFGLPAAEAQACGTPVVATTAGALPEIVAHGETGLLVPPGDAAQLAEAITMLLDDAELRTRLGSNGAIRMASHFGWGLTAERTLDLYTRVLERRKARRAVT